MRDKTVDQGAMFAHVSLEERIPKSHPLGELRAVVDTVLASMDKEFQAGYAQTGRLSVPPGRLLKAMLLQILSTIRSERLRVESIDYNLLCRWFLGVAIDDPVWDRSTFSAHRERLFNINKGTTRVFFKLLCPQFSWTRNWGR